MAPQPTVLMEHVTVTWPGVPEAVSGQTKRACMSPTGEPAAKRLCLGAPPPPQESALFYWRCFAEERSRAYNHTFGSGMAGPDFSDIRRQAGEAAVTGPPLEEPRREPSKQRRDRSRHGSGKVRKKRTAIQAMVRPLKRWLVRHRHNPYPSREEKLQLGETAGMNLGQVSTWFANARRRLKQVVAGELLPWQERVRLYNSCVKGNAELLSLSSDDSVWNDDGKDDNRQESTAIHDSEERIELNGIDPADHDDHGDLGDLGDPGDLRELRESADPADPSTAPVPAPSSPSRGARSPPAAAGSPKYKKKMLLRYLSDTERYSSAADADDEASGGSRGDSGSSEGRAVAGCEPSEPRLTAADETEARASETTKKEDPRASTDGCRAPSPSAAQSSQGRSSPPRVVPNSVPQRSEAKVANTTSKKSTAAESAETATVNGFSEVAVPSREISVPATAAPEQQKTPSRPEGTSSRPAKRPAGDPAAPRPRKRRPPAEQGDSSAVKRRLQFDDSASKRPRLSPPSAVPCYPGELVVAPPSVPVCGAPAVYPGLDLSLCQPPQPQLPLHQYQQQLPQRQHQQHQQQENQHLQQEPQQWEQYPSSMTLLPWVPVWAAPGAAPYWDGAPALAEEAAYRQVALPAPPAVWECWPTPADGRPAYLPLM